MDENAAHSGASIPEGVADNEAVRHTFFAAAPPSLANIARVAEALGDLRDRVVFIGGAIAPILQTNPPFPRIRPTKDVDGVIASTSYTDANQIYEELTRRGFRPDTSSTAHSNRWISPEQPVPFDLVPAGAHLGGSGNPWDQTAIDTAHRHELYPGLEVRHATAPAFLALKWAAHADRGMNDPRQSHDLEDLLALIASRPVLIDEVRRAPEHLREFIREQAVKLLSDEDVDELLDAHLNNAHARQDVVQIVRARLQEMTQA
jgi:hypothetical protein